MMKRVISLIVLFGIAGVVHSETSLFEISTLMKSPGPSRWYSFPCVARIGDGRLLCVFSDQGDRIAGTFSGDSGVSWSDPITLIDSPVESDYDPNIVVAEHRVFVLSTTRLANEIKKTTTWCTRSEDDGKTWTKPYILTIPHRYTSGKVQPGIRLRSGRLLFPYSYDLVLEHGVPSVKRENQMDSQAGVMLSDDNGDHWIAGGDVHVKENVKMTRRAISGADEPALVELSDGTVYALLRTGTDHLWETRSHDGGETWEPPRPSPLVGHNAPATLCKLERPKGAIVCVWNDSPKNRWPLMATVSLDECRSWSRPRMLACVPGFQSCYPGSALASDGTIIAVWQQQRLRGRRDIMVARFNLAWLQSAE